MESQNSQQHVIARVLESVRTIVERTVVGRGRENLYTSLLCRSVSLVGLAGVLTVVLNVIVFLTLAVRLRRFDPVLFIVVWGIAYLILFMAWEHIVRLLGERGVFRRSFSIPYFLRQAVAMVVFVLALLVFFGCLVSGVAQGQASLLGVGVVGAGFAYQFFSLLLHPEMLGMSYRKEDSSRAALVFPEWLLFKVYVGYFLLMEATVIVLIITPIVLMVDLVTIWSAPASHILSLYATVSFHQGLWVCALLLPIVGYVMLQGWVFCWELLESVWRCVEQKVNKEE